jgi:hypothetical protein
MDVLHCDRCGGRMKLLALVKDPVNAQRFLAGLGLPTGPPPPTLPVPKVQSHGFQLAFDEPA